MTNYIPDSPWAEPPAEYFLQAIYDYDAMLVVLPSRLFPKSYVLARRKQWGPGLTDHALLDTVVQPDTRMCILNNVTPVCMLKKQGLTWDVDGVISTLRRRDIWAAGGGDAAADLLDAADEREREAQRAATRDDLYNRSGDAWRSYQARTGQRSIRFGEQPSQAVHSVQGAISVPTGEETPALVSTPSSTGEQGPA